MLLIICLVDPFGVIGADVLEPFRALFECCGVVTLTIRTLQVFGVDALVAALSFFDEKVAGGVMMVICTDDTF